jgi:serine protease AprX
MAKQGVNRMRNLFKRLSIILLLALLLGAAGLAAAPEQQANLQPALAELAAESPGETVRVMVGARGERAELAAQVESLGGEVVKDLHIINALAAEMPAGATADLARYASVSWLSLDAPVISSGKPGGGGGSLTENVFLDTLGVRDVWDMGYDGQGIGIAVIDSGSRHPDLDANVVVEQPFNIHNKIEDFTGHGTHVTGIIVGSGAGSRGDFAGIAPGASILALNVSAYNGSSYESDVVAAMEWVLNNKDAYNIRVVNLSINSTVEGAYHDSALNAAAEILWFNGIVVVVSAGNSGTSSPIDTIAAAPANDPFVITVGATDEQGTARKQDDTIPAFSASGWTLEGTWKPDIYAPGVDIISPLADMSYWEYQYPDRKITTRTAGTDYEYFRASGTSMAAPMVSGAAALLLQAEPGLTPDQVKHRLTWTGTVIEGDDYLDVYEALTWQTTDAANEDVVPHMLLAKMALMAYWSSDNGGENIDWSTVDWNSVNWSSVNWNSVNWNSVDWESVDWTSVNWDSIDWSSVNWSSVNWNSVNWNSVNWNSVNWNSVNWNSVNWNSVSFDN